MRTILKGTPEPPIHVLEVIGNAIVGGMENYVYSLVKHLPAYGIKLTCLSPYESSYTAQLRRLGCDVYITQMHVDVPWRSLQFATQLIRENHIDLIHAHLPRAHALAGLAGRLTGRPAVATFHGMELSSEELGLSQLSGTHIITVCQQALCQALALGIPSERLSLIANGVDTRAYHAGRSGADFRSHHLIPLDNPVVGFAGRISFEKGPDHFVRMAGYIHERRPDVHFLMVGEGPLEGDVRSLVIQHNLSEVFHMVGLGKNMPEIYPAMDMLVMSSRVEGMPFALLEAMSCGLPVVSFSVGGVSEMIEVGTVGWTESAENWAGLGDATLGLLANPGKMKTMGQAARKHVEEKYDLYTSLQQLTNLFRALVKLDTPDNSQLPSAWPVKASSSSEQLPIQPVGKTPPQEFRNQ